VATAQTATIPATPAAEPSVTLTSSAVAASEARIEQVTLEQAVERALRKNPTAQIAALEIDRAEALVRQARASSFPTLTGNATYTRLDNDRVSVTNGVGRVVAEKDQFNANLTLQVPLFAPARWAQWSQAKENVNVLRESNSETRRQLIIAVARAFLAVVAQHRVLELGERTVSVARSHAEYAQTRLEGGLGKRLDAVRASQQHASYVAALEQSRVGLTRAMEALGVLLGEEGPVDVATIPALGTLQTLPSSEQVAAERQDLAVARARLKYAVRRVNDGWRDYLPMLTAQLQPFYQNPPTMTMPETGWQAQLLLTLPLYDGGMRYGTADERSALKAQAEQQMQALLRQSRSEVRVAVSAVDNAERALIAAQQAAELARNAEKMALLAYEAGASTNLEVIDAERQSRDAETSVLIAEDTLRNARLDLLIATGKFPTKY
jgi:outer membrane protein TolC